MSTSTVIGSRSITSATVRPVRGSAQFRQQLIPPQHADDPSVFGHRDVAQAATEGIGERLIGSDSTHVPECKLPNAHAAHRALDTHGPILSVGHDHDED